MTALSSRRHDAEVIVVGGGPAGASTAFHLAAAGADVLLLDRARFPRDKTCAECLSPEASRLLAAMGALDAVEPHAAQLAGMIVRAPCGAEIRGRFVAGHGYRPFRDRALAVRRRVLDAILVERSRAAGARVEEGARVVDLVRDAAGRVTGVQLLGAGGRTVERRARTVVGADGLRSVVARRLGLARLLPWPRRLALVTHYEGVADVGDFGEMHVERDGFVGIADVGAGLTTVALVVPASEARRLGGDPAAYLAAWLARRAHLAPRFARARRVDPVRTTGPFAASARRAWAPGAALVGDAADFFDPFTGEGVYCGLRGGELLAPHALAAARAGRARGADDALAAWGAARRREFRGKWAVERMIGVAVASPPLVDRAARVLSRRADMADLLVGVAGDFVPASRVLTLSYVWRLFLAPLPPRP
jgi:flavin-dependent dehydrogenase